MATELCGSKLISPYFGSSLYVWASVIAITLGSLAFGYFYGGRLSLKQNKPAVVTGILLIAAIWMSCMPLISNLFGPLAIRLGLLPAVVIASSLLLIVPMLLMGAASPIIISIQTVDTKDSGRVSGLVYSISTLGGIISTFLCGFFLIPSFGVYLSLIVFAILLLLSLALLIEKKKRINIALAFLFIAIMGFKSKTPLKNCIYEKDGILGKINIIDDTSASGTVIRKLLVNNVVQTEMDLEKRESVSDYVRILNENIDSVASGNALVLGLGGGVTSGVLVKKGFKVKGVDLDQRIIDAARDFFYLDRSVEAICGDARHFVNGSSEKFNLILLDIFKAEEQPSHVITTESLRKFKQLMDLNAMLVINWHGYSEGERGYGTSILVNTLEKSGFKYKFASSSEIEDQRNLVIFCSLGPVKKLKGELPIILPPTDLTNSDTHPVLEKYNALANQTWRKNYILYYYSH
jgi:MFS family permease